MKRLRAGILVVAVSGTAWLAGAAPAAAATVIWEGQCTILGESTFEQPIGGIPGPARYTDAGTGRCTGTLNGVAVSDTPILLAAEGMGSVGCLASQSVMFGTLTFTRGTRSGRDDLVTHYAGEASGGLGQMVSRSRGRDGGYGIAYVRALSDQTTIDACRTQTLESTRWQATTQTLTPSVSETRTRRGRRSGAITRRDAAS